MHECPSLFFPAIVAALLHFTVGCSKQGELQMNATKTFNVLNRTLSMSLATVTASRWVFEIDSLISFSKLK